MALVTLLYHEVRENDTPWPGDSLLRLSVSMRRLREHVSAIAERMEILDLGDALRHGPGLERSKNRYITLTFDDGYIGSLRRAQQVLAEVGCTATAFVSAAHCDSGEPFWWDALGAATDSGAWKEGPPADPLQTLRKLRHLRYREAKAVVARQVMPDAWSMCCDHPGSWRELADLDPRQFSVASHGWWHEDFSLLPLPELRRDLRAASTRLGASRLSVIPAVAYPFGGDGFVTWEQLREVVGLEHCYGMLVQAGRTRGARPSHPLTLKRFIVNDIEASELLSQLDGLFQGD